jgi:murein DD-endopeptidase MepM/ murein hydrolase activator NlpD
MSDRTIKYGMSGSDVKGWQRDLNNQLHRWGIPHQLKEDGVYGISTRSFGASVLHGLGIDTRQMAYGVSSALRLKVRHRKLSADERVRYAARARWRKRFAYRFTRHVASPLHKVLADSWGWHPGIHDGLDLIAEPDAVIYAMTNGRIVRADPSGWWGLGAQASAGHPVADGDGIIIIRCAVNDGPFKHGLNLCYGHAEKAKVHVGDHVRAGQAIGHAGFANAWHVHFMVNNNSDVRGVGDRDPRPYYDYARKHD